MAAAEIWEDTREEAAFLASIYLGEPLMRQPLTVVKFADHPSQHDAQPRAWCYVEDNRFMLRRTRAGSYILTSNTGGQTMATKNEFKSVDEARVARFEFAKALGLCLCLFLVLDLALPWGGLL